LYHGLLHGVMRHGYLVLIWSGSLLLLGRLVWRYAGHPALSRIAAALQVSVVLLVTAQAIWLASAVLPDMWKVARADEEDPAVRQGSAAVAPEQLPDIYYIVLDAYARDDVLGDLYDHDNRPFLEALRKRGFFVGGRSRSNYNQTRYALAASLNMKYVGRPGLTQCKTTWPAHGMIDDNRLARLLKRQGYQTVAFATGYSLTECRSFDRYVSEPGQMDELSGALLATTPFSPLLGIEASETRGSDAIWTDSRRHRQRVLRTLDLLPQVAGQSTSPVFVFAHIVCPHPPFVFDAQGNEAPSLPDGEAEDYVTRYREQLSFLNRKVLQAIDRILAGARRPPLIVLQADHGPASILNDWDLIALVGGRQQAASAPGRASDLDAGLWERFSILSAVYLPPGVDVGLYDTMTPVNTFRVILDHYFRTNLGLLEDKSYLPTRYGGYEFVDVTESVTVGSANGRLSPDVTAGPRSSPDRPRRPTGTRR